MSFSNNNPLFDKFFEDMDYYYPIVIERMIDMYEKSGVAEVNKKVPQHNVDNFLRIIEASNSGVQYPGSNFYMINSHKAPLANADDGKKALNRNDSLLKGKYKTSENLKKEQEINQKVSCFYVYNEYTDEYKPSFFSIKKKYEKRGNVFKSKKHAYNVSENFFIKKKVKLSFMNEKVTAEQIAVAIFAIRILLWCQGRFSITNNLSKDSKAEIYNYLLTGKGNLYKDDIVKFLLDCKTVVRAHKYIILSSVIEEELCMNVISEKEGYRSADSTRQEDWNQDKDFYIVKETTGKRLSVSYKSGKISNPEYLRNYYRNINRDISNWKPDVYCFPKKRTIENFQDIKTYEDYVFYIGEDVRNGVETEGYSLSEIFDQFM